MISTPSSRAFSSLLPASSPASTTDVFLLTPPETFPPRASMRLFASSRFSVGSVPVSTKIFPAKIRSGAPSSVPASAGVATAFTPAASSASHSARFSGRRKNSATLAATTSPMPSIVASSSALAASSASSERNFFAKSFAVISPTPGMPSPLISRHSSRERDAAMPSSRFRADFSLNLSSVSSCSNVSA